MKKTARFGLLVIFGLYLTLALRAARGQGLTGSGPVATASAAPTCTATATILPGSAATPSMNAVSAAITANNQNVCLIMQSGTDFESAPLNFKPKQILSGQSCTATTPGNCTSIITGALPLALTGNAWSQVSSTLWSFPITTTTGNGPFLINDNDNNSPTSKYCQATVPFVSPQTRAGCAWDQDLYDYQAGAPILLEHVIASFPAPTFQPSPPLSPGQWTADYSNSHTDFSNTSQGSNAILTGTIWVNPPAGAATSDKWSLSQTQQAVLSATANWQMQNLQVWGFRSSLQFGAIEPQGPGDVVNNVEAWNNHGYGIKPRLTTATGETISNNYVHHNTTAGIGSGGGPGGSAPCSSANALTFSGNLVKWNNTAFVNAVGFEGGGSKFSSDGCLNVVNNTFDSNNGPGLWSDVSDCNLGQCVLTGNTISHNVNDGLRFELGYNGVIQSNMLNYNGERNNLQCLANGIPSACCTGLQTGTCCNDSDASCSQCNGSTELSLVDANNTAVGGSGLGNTINTHCGGIIFVQDTRQLVNQPSTVTYNVETAKTPALQALTKAIGGYNFYNAGTTQPLSNVWNDVTYDHNTYSFPSQPSPDTNKNFSFPISGVTNPVPTATATPWAGWIAPGGSNQDTHGSCTSSGGNC